MAGEAAPPVDQEDEMKGVWFGSKIRIEATIESDLYKAIQQIILEERRLAQERKYPVVPISHVVEMILRRGVADYRASKQQPPVSP